MDELTTDDNSIINPSLLRVFRVARVARLLRVLQFAQGIRQLLVALIISLPALFNVGTLLFLVIFIYAIIGMSTFGHVKKQNNIDETVNFETFGRSMMLLFRLSTGAGWNDILEALMLREPDCDPNYGGFPNGNCGYPVGAVIYLVSYIFIVFLIIVNMYIAIILENVYRSQEGKLFITKENIDSYYQKWSSFVTDGKQYLPVCQLSDFVASLDEPLKIAKPNEQELVRMGISVRMGYRVECFDLLRCLVKYSLERNGESPRAFEEIASKLESRFRRRVVRKKGNSPMGTSPSVSNESQNEMVDIASEIQPRPISSPSITKSPDRKYPALFSKAVILRRALKGFMDKRSTRGDVSFKAPNNISSDRVRKCSCSPLSSVSSNQEISDLTLGLDYTLRSRSQVSVDSGRSSTTVSPDCVASPEGCAYDPYDSEGDSV